MATLMPFYFFFLETPLTCITLQKKVTQKNLKFNFFWRTYSLKDMTSLGMTQDFEDFLQRY